MFSPSAKAGLGVGDILVTINDWNIEAMDNIQVKQRRYPLVKLSQICIIGKQDAVFIGSDCIDSYFDALIAL